MKSVEERYVEDCERVMSLESAHIEQFEKEIKFYEAKVEFLKDIRLSAIMRMKEFGESVEQYKSEITED